MRPLRCFFGFLGVLATASSGVTWGQTAQDEEDLAMLYGDKTFVSVATGHKQALRRAPSVATVITAQEIEAMGATDLDEILETVPGLHVSRSANIYAPLYVMRGVYSLYLPQVLMLQNGIPITTQYVGNKGNIWGGYPVEHIERIEVLRGPGSALYGADAYAGVINIITKTAADTPGTEVTLGAGSFNTRNASVQHGGQLGPVDVAAYLRVGSSDGIRETVTADAQTRFDRIFGTRASLAPGPVRTGYDAVDANLDLAYGNWRARAGYKLRDNVGTGAGTASGLDPLGQQHSERITADLSWTDPQFARDWGLGATASYLHYTQEIPTDFRLFPPGANLGGGVSANGFIAGPDTWERQWRFSGFATYSGFSGHEWRFGLGHDDLDMYQTRETRNFTYSATGALVPVAGGSVVDFSETNPFIRPQRRWIDYVYVQDEWNFARDWTFTGGLRHDRYSDFGTTTNPRLALVWDAALDVTVKLLSAHAFRAPAFSEVASLANPVNRGNPNLRPETVGTTELAVAWRARPDTSVNMTVYRYDMNDIIRPVGGMFINSGSQDGYGAEFEAVWDVNRRLRLTGNYAWQRSLDEATQQDAGHVPQNHIYARADWRVADAWQLSTQLNWVADRKRALGDTRPNVGDYTTLDLTVRTDNRNSKHKPWDFAASVRNLFNADVREPSIAPGVAIPNDLPMAPRSVYLQVSYRM